MRVAEPQLDTTAMSAEDILVGRSWQKHLLTFLMVFGPCMNVMEAENDAGAVSTYFQAGGQYAQRSTRTARPPDRDVGHAAPPRVGNGRCVSLDALNVVHA